MLSAQTDRVDASAASPLEVYGVVFTDYEYFIFRFLSQWLQRERREQRVTVSTMKLT